MYLQYTALLCTFTTSLYPVTPVSVPLPRQTWSHWGGRAFNLGGWVGGVDTALWLDPPPPKKAQLTGPRNPTETEPRAPEVTRTQKIRQKMKMVFLEPARRGGSEKSSFAMDVVKNITIFNASAPEFIMTD